MKMLMIIVRLALAVLVVAGVFLRYSMGKPLYEPGMVSGVRISGLP